MQKYVRSARYNKPFTALFYEIMAAGSLLISGSKERLHDFKTFHPFARSLSKNYKHTLSPRSVVANYPQRGEEEEEEGFTLGWRAGVIGVEL